MMSASNRVFVFWTWADKLGWIASELEKGRARQGWGCPGSQLLDERGRLREYEDWRRTYSDFVGPNWPAEFAGDKMMRTRHSILKTMLEMERGDIILVPGVPDGKVFTTAEVTDGYRFDDSHFTHAVAGALVNDLGHVVQIDPRSRREHPYEESLQSRLIVSRFPFYRRAITRVRNVAHANLIRQVHAED